MLDITTIILTFNEEIHIKRCLENVLLFSEMVYVVDCFSTDNTCAICENYSKVTVIQHSWPGNQAEQFNWAIDNLPIKTEWIMRVDADEYLTSELINELKTRINSLSKDVSACVFPLGRAFGGRLLKHGIVNNVSMIRLFRKGKARYDNRLMDEHLMVLDGEVCVFNNKFVDDNHQPISKFIEKHNSYSTKEAIILLNEEFGLMMNVDECNKGRLADEVLVKRKQKNRYAKLPLFHRAIWYFFYRYVIKLGFLDGKEGFEWDFFQGLWYRLLVDAKISEIKKACGNDPERIGRFIKERGYTLM